MTDFDVIVSGGGPSGLQTARFLSENNFCVALFEKDSEIGKNVVCSGVISREAFEIYDLPGHSIIGKLREAELNSPSNGNILYKHPEESVVVVDRHKFDSFLGLCALNSGTDIHLNTRVLSLENGKESVLCRVRKGDELKTYSSKLVVIATGVSFNLQESLGMGRPKKILKGIQVETDLPEIDKLKMYWGNQYSKGFFGWAIPLLNGKARIGVMSEQNPVGGLRNILKQLNLTNGINSSEYMLKRRGISFGRIGKTVFNRVIAVGEAAGLVKTTTGGGIYYGLISADIASGVIKRSYNGSDFNLNKILIYEKLLKDRFSKELKFGEFFNKFYSGLSDSEINDIFDSAKNDDLLSFISDRGKFDWHKDAVINILKSPNLRRVLLKGVIKQGSKFAVGSYLRT